MKNDASVYRKALRELEDIICELLCDAKQENELYVRETGYEDHIYKLSELITIYENDEAEYAISKSPDEDPCESPVDFECPKCHSIVYNSYDAYYGKKVPSYCPKCEQQLRFKL